MATTKSKQDMNAVLAAPKDIEPLLDSRWSELEVLLAETGISRERFTRTVVHALAESPDVMRASRGSILLAVLDAARMGLEPTGQYGGGYLIRRGGKATFAIDWRAFIRLGMRAGAIRSADADLVYEGDQFEYQRGTNPIVFHVPTLGPSRGQPERGKLTHAYCVLTLPDGSKHFEVMEAAEIDAVRRRSPARDDGPWITDPGEMSRKTVVRRAFKYVPAVYNPALQYALSREDELEGAAPSPQNGRGGLPARRTAAVLALAGRAPAEPQDEPQAEPPSEADPVISQVGDDDEQEPAQVAPGQLGLIDGYPADPEEGLPE